MTRSFEAPCGRRVLRFLSQRQKNAQTATSDGKEAAALLRRGDELFEALLAPIPTKLDFRPSDANASRSVYEAQRKRLQTATREFTEWLTERTRRTGEAHKMYQQAIAAERGRTRVAAAARIGQLFHAFASELRSAEPGPAPTSAKMPQAEMARYYRKAFCEALEDHAGSLEKKALEGYSACKAASAELGPFPEIEAVCTAGLEALEAR
jgi:hypothetical protein